MNITQLTKTLDHDDFYRAVYSLQRAMLDKHDECEVGTDTLPANERIRFKAAQNLGFPGAAIEGVKEVEGIHGQPRLDISVNFMGLTGPSGVLPRHYTELVMQRGRIKDTAMREFFDLFNHRLIALRYRAWEKYQYPLQHERYLRGRPSNIDTVLQSLTGARQPLDVYLGGLFANPVRNTQSLRQALECLSGCKVKVEEFVGRWISLAPEQQSYLGSRLQPEGQHAQLGVSCMLGERAWDITSALSIDIEVDDRDTATGLMSRGELLSILQSVVGNYVPPAMKIDWYVLTTYQNLPVASLDGKGLGLGLGGALMSSHQLKDKVLRIPVG
ncbi:type VI secretion system baseplate subunit TssG [Photobacterium aphoticum]|uniref:type VI secretion system baseplate subunit TssG n=1 Tax=Photobacterium aphoticum TaxID=754436 RepID=UPI00069EA191|nr:type VI secretion system baseplate subunit TssG [Photobacterium aphoticum]PSU57760.1 type VI secretion system baseplate subunit TssG [Photobacterium aphoticum]